MESYTGLLSRFPILLDWIFGYASWQLVVVQHFFFNMEENGCSFNISTSVTQFKLYIIISTISLSRNQTRKIFSFDFLSLLSLWNILYFQSQFIFFFSTFVFMDAWILFIYGLRVMGVIGLVYLYLLKESVFKIDTYKF